MVGQGCNKNKELQQQRIKGLFKSFYNYCFWTPAKQNKTNQNKTNQNKTSGFPLVIDHTLWTTRNQTAVKALASVLKLGPV